MFHDSHCTAWPHSSSQASAWIFLLHFETLIPQTPFGISDSLWFAVYNSSMFGSQRSKANKDLPIPFLKIGFNIWFMRFRLKNIFRILSLNRHYYKIPNVVGWIMPPQRCLHLIDVIPQTCEHVSLHDTREFTDMKS